MPRVLLGNPDGVDPDSLAHSVSFGRGVPTPCTHRRSPLWRTFHSTRGGIPCADISHPEFRAPTFYIQNFVCQHFTSGYLTTEWERRTLQLLRIDISGLSDNAYHESFSLSIQCYGVLLKLSDISDRLFEIFCFRYLMSKSPNSSCNPPIIGFLSL